MQFRWIALIALWTCISGPIFAPVGATPSSRHADRPHTGRLTSELHR
jgi:hypothetical protein